MTPAFVRDINIALALTLIGTGVVHRYGWDIGLMVCGSVLLLGLVSNPKGGKP